MATFEMWWDCPRCGTGKLLGKTHRYCPNCGAPQDAAARYFPPQHLAVEANDHVYVGVDIVCSGCDTPCSNAAAHCPNCGAPVGDNDLTAKRVADGADPLDAASAVVGIAAKAPAPAPSVATKKKMKVPPALLYALAIGATALALGLVALMVAVFWTRSVDVTVTSHAWERKVEVEQYSTVHDSAWCDAKPAGARNVRRSEKERSTRRVADGQDCRTVRSDNGDGTYSTSEECSTRYREEPVYDDWCSYDVDRWVTDRWDQARGSDRAPRWPEPRVTGCASLGCTRLGSRSASYMLAISAEDGTATVCDVDQALWETADVGQTLHGRQRVATGALTCKLTY